MSTLPSKARRRSRNRPFYYVTYIVTRDETYRVRADSPEEARDLAFENGTYLGSDETISVEPFTCEAIDAPPAACKTKKRGGKS